MDPHSTSGHSCLAGAGCLSQLPAVATHPLRISPWAGVGLTPAGPTRALLQCENASHGETVLTPPSWQSREVGGAASGLVSCHHVEKTVWVRPSAGTGVVKAEARVGRQGLQFWDFIPLVPEGICPLPFLEFHFHELIKGAEPDNDDVLQQGYCRLEGRRTWMLSRRSEVFTPGYPLSWVVGCHG